MKILLLNDNPVVSKLVTLSAQKTSDELEAIRSAEEVTEGAYDLVVVDDALYSDGLLEALQTKIDFQKSLLIMAKNAELPEGFTNTIKKPFLPTDLVELFVLLDKEVGDTHKMMHSEASVSNREETPLLEPEFEELEEISSLDDILDGDELDELDILEDFESDDVLLDDLDDDTNSDDFDLDEALFEDEDELSSQGVLDKEELQEVQDLLDDTEDENEDLDSAFEDLDKELQGLEDEGEEELSALSDTFEDESNEDDVSEDILLDESDLKVDEEEPPREDSAAFEYMLDEEIDDTELEAKIEEAMSELSEEELEEEIELDEGISELIEDEIVEDKVAEDTLVEDMFASLKQRDIKLAVGEEVEDNAEELFEEIAAEDFKTIDEEMEEDIAVNSLQDDNKNDVFEDKDEIEVEGLAALKNLLAVLSDKKVAASLKGMQISINITLGEKNGVVLVLSGPSGAGKSSLINKISEDIGDFYFSISTTTRPKRDGEVDGVHYHFATHEAFQKDIEENHFLEYALVHGNYYGTSIKPVRKALEKGQLVIFDIDVQGNTAINNRLGDITTSVFITPPSLKELEKRLKNRSTDSSEVIHKRIEMAKREIQRISEYDFLVINEDLDKAAEMLKQIAITAKLKIPLLEINEFVQKWEDL